MNKRQKTLKLMAEQAGLTSIKFDCRSSRHYLMCEADNGNRHEFWLSTASTLDPRAEQNELSRMKRFARENQAPQAKEQITQPQRKEPTTMPAQRPIAIAASTPAIDTTLKAKPVAQVLDLSHAEFLRLAMWLNTQNLSTIQSMDVLVLESSKHMGKPVDEPTVRSAMIELAKDEPAHWREPTDPHAIIVREVGRLLKEFGMAPTDAFNKLSSRMVP